MPVPPPPAPQNTPITSALQVVSSALRLIGVLAAGESIDIASANDALMVLNQMIDAWNADRLAIFTTRIDDFPFTLGKQSYTLGSGGDFDMIRPAQIDNMSAILINNPSNPIEEPIAMYTVWQWQNEIPVKVVDSSFPLICYDDGGFPLRTLNFWPIPTSQPCNLRLYSWQALTLASSLNDSIILPPGYSEAFRYNLAVRLAPEFQATLQPIVQQIAVQSLATLRTINAPELLLQSDLIPSPAGYNWSADMFNNPFS